MDLGSVNSPAAAFVAGLVTSIHCVGMCGPLACSLMPGRREAGGLTADPQVISTVYHVMRLTGYAALGAAAGALGQAPLQWLSQPVMRWLPWTVVVAFVALALRWDRFLPKLGSLGRWVWRLRAWVQPRSRVTAAAVLGAATPLLPCGPLYFIVTLALLSGSALRGLEFMLAFAAGTIPLLWVAQTEFQWVRQRLSAVWLNRARITLALVAAVAVAWRLRATLGLPGPEPGSLMCH